jgi:hypothetical protein
MIKNQLNNYQERKERRFFHQTLRRQKNSSCRKTQRKVERRFTKYEEKLLKLKEHKRKIPSPLR